MLESGLALPPVVVLAGGFGTRLRPAIADVPKALAPVAGRPFLDHLLLHLEGEGATEVIVSTGYMGEMVERFVAERSYGRLRVRSVREPEPLGTGGALRHVMDAAGLERPFLAANGDTLFGGSLAELTAFHAGRADAVATLALVRVPDTEPFGSVRFDAATGRVTGFDEKRAGGGAGWINAGVYMLTPGALEGLAPGRRASLERDVFPASVGHGLYARSFPDAVFLDIGTPADFDRAPRVLRDARGPFPSPSYQSPA